MVKKIRHIVYCLALLLTSLSANAATQDLLDKKISIQLRDVLLRDALEKISSVAEVSFVYTSNDALNANKVTLNANNEKIGVLLYKILSPYSLSFSVMYDRIVIRKDNRNNSIPT